MAKRYIIDEIRADRWLVRMRDRETDEVVEVPIELGALWPGKLRGDAVPRDAAEAAPREAAEAAPPQGDFSEVSVARSTASEQEAAAPVVAKPPAEKKARQRGMTRVTEPEVLKEIMTSPMLRSQDVDEETVEPDDLAALRKMQALIRRAKGRRDGKVGDLGWDETTDAGRSGLIARFGEGAYKILHASGDTYALFYEWRDGRYEQIGCGSAQAMMNLANQKAQDDPPEPPPSHLSLELARFHCGTPEQKSSAVERLEPAFAEAERNTPGSARKRSAADADEQMSRSLERASAEFEARQKKERRRRSEPAAPEPNAAMDQQLTESLQRALAQFDAQDSASGKGE